MKSCRVELICGAETLEEVPIKRGIYQGDVLITVAVCNFPHASDTQLLTANPGYEF